MVEPGSTMVGRHQPKSRRLLSLWGGLPDFCALVPVVWCLSYSATMLIVGSRVGRQSSTFGIGIGLALLAAPLLGAVGLMLGRLARYILDPFVPGKLARLMKWCAPMVLVVVAIMASRHASGPIYAAEREALPRVIVNSAQLHKRNAGLPTDGITRAVRALDYLAKVNQPVPWGVCSAHLRNLGEALEVSFTPAGHALRIPLPGITYITSVDAIPLKMGPMARPVLALLIRGRATGRRDLLAVISESGELVYLELLDRFWNDRSVPLAIGPSPAGDLILVGSEPQNLLVFQ